MSEHSTEAVTILEALRENNIALVDCVEHICKDGTTALAMRLEVDGLGDVGVWVPEYTREPHCVFAKEKEGGAG